MTLMPLICEKKGSVMPINRASRILWWNNCRIEPLSWAMVSSISRHFPRGCAAVDAGENVQRLPPSGPAWSASGGFPARTTSSTNRIAAGSSPTSNMPRQTSSDEHHPPQRPCRRTRGSVGPFRPRRSSRIGRQNAERDGKLVDRDQSAAPPGRRYLGDIHRREHRGDADARAADQPRRHEVPGARGTADPMAQSTNSRAAKNRIFLRPKRSLNVPAIGRADQASDRPEADDQAPSIAIASA